MYIEIHVHKIHADLWMFIKAKLVYVPMLATCDLPSEKVDSFSLFLIVVLFPSRNLSG